MAGPRKQVSAPGPGTGSRALPAPPRVAPTPSTEHKQHEHNDQHGFHDPHVPPTTSRLGASPHHALEAPSSAGCVPSGWYVRGRHAWGAGLRRPGLVEPGPPQHHPEDDDRAHDIDDRVHGPSLPDGAPPSAEWCSPGSPARPGAQDRARVTSPRRLRPYPFVLCTSHSLAYATPDPPHGARGPTRSLRWRTGGLAEWLSGKLRGGVGGPRPRSRSGSEGSEKR